jgi:hypothetical protein
MEDRAMTDGVVAALAQCGDRARGNAEATS